MLSVPACPTVGMWGRAACGPTGVSGAGGPGRCVCRWAAARPRVVRAASFARRVASKPGQALPPPTGTAADPSGALHTSGAWSLMLLGALSRSPAGPYRRPSISRVIPLRLVQTLNLQRWNCNVLGVVWCVLLQTSSIQGVFRVDFWSVVTNVVNLRAFSLKIKVFGRRLTTFVTRVLARGFTLLRFDDVCNVVCPLALRPGPPVPPVVCVFWRGSSVLDRNGASG